uniref:Protein kinase domain-containing protein n=1 Tax=Vitis vinifera TaxID=29760 RepID=F6HCE2_VITVI
MRSWNESVHFCQWSGVTCGRQHQKVTVLDLHSQQLVGLISPHIGNLSFIRVLLLQNNSFNGEIPQEVGRLGRLETLRLDSNSLDGEIPSNISSCSNLISLTIGFNSVVGKLPEELGSLSMLQFLAVQRNNLSGSIPPFGNLSSLGKFSATQNNLVGKKSLLKVSYQSLLWATDGFSSSNLIGVGSFGSVYRGILVHDGTVIAVKVLNLLRKGASKSFFIAECEALRNIRHRNLVKVLTAYSGADYQGNDVKSLPCNL